MSLRKYFIPTKPPQSGKKFRNGDWSKHLDIHTEQSFPELKNKKVALFCIRETRTQSSPANSVRQQLAGLEHKNLADIIADLGDMMPEEGEQKGKNFGKFLKKVETVVNELRKQDIVSLIISPRQYFTIAQIPTEPEYPGKFRLAGIDPELDFTLNKKYSLNSDNYLTTALSNSFASFTGLGMQNFRIKPDVRQHFESWFGQLTGLGEIRENIRETEPWIRWADAITADISSVRYSDAPASQNGGSGGLFSEEFCQLMRFAGMNEKCSSLGIYEWKSSGEGTNLTSALIAQSIWHFVEGVFYRTEENPRFNAKDFYQFVLNFEKESARLKFYKSRKTGRWWMEDISGTSETNSDKEIFPCSYKDYQQACNDELPDRYWRMLI